MGWAWSAIEFISLWLCPSEREAEENACNLLALHQILTNTTRGSNRSGLYQRAQARQILTRYFSLLPLAPHPDFVQSNKEAILLQENLPCSSLQTLSTNKPAAD